MSGLLHSGQLTSIKESAASIPEIQTEWSILLKMSFVDNLRQRKLFQWTVAYLAAAWLLVQLVDVLGEHWGMSTYFARFLDITLIIGLFVTLVVAWYHGDQGRQRVSGPELLLIAGLFAIGGLALGVLNNGEDQDVQHETLSANVKTTDGAPWIAVLPFAVQTQNQELEEFAAGMAEDIANGLSDFSYLLVLSRNATANLATESVDILQLGEQLGARYVLQGSLRRVGPTTRISTQLVDAQNGTQIWSETFDRELTANEMLAVQDELTDRIVATVADPAGVVVRTLAANTDRKSGKDLTPYESVLRYFLFQQRISVDDHLITRDALERAVQIEPGYADAWTSLSLIYQQEHMNNMNTRPDSLQRGLEAARTAVGLDPASSRAHFAMAQVSYFLRDLGSFNIHAERAIALNPRNTDTLAMVGIMMGYSGDWDRGVEITTDAMQLNPHHAGWYHFVSFFNEYHQQHYTDALAIAQKINLPEYWATPLALTIAHAQLGHEVEARRTGGELLRVWPRFKQEYYQLGLVNWMYSQPDVIEHIAEGLLKAGVDLETPKQLQE
jgi:adenylate cyclase